MAEPISYDDFARLELRVAKVLEARPHPNADKLLLLQVDVGDQQKQIVAGIREHYTPEQLVGKLIGGTAPPSSVYLHVLEAPSPLKRSISVMSPLLSP